MGYRAGIGPMLAVMASVKCDGPHILCDGCGLVYQCEWGNRVPPRWFLDGEPPPGWRQTRTEVTRTDLCPRCKG